MSEVWEAIYSEGNHLNRYPWDSVVSFLYGEAGRRGCSLGDLRILEVGCGSASNLWFAAREGATVVGTDISESALRYARNRFRNDGLEGKFEHAELPDLPDYAADPFDVVIDRACLTSCSRSGFRAVLSKLADYVVSEGRIFSTFYGKRHSSFEIAKLGVDGRVHNIAEGSLTGVGPIAFYDEQEAAELFAPEWNVVSLLNRLETTTTGGRVVVSEEWHATASLIKAIQYQD